MVCLQFSELCCSSGHALFTTNSPSECVEKYFLKYPQRLLQKSLKRSLSPLYFLEFYKGVKRNLVGQGEGGGVRRGRRMMFIPWRAEWKTLKKRVAFGSPYCLIAIAIAIAIAIVCVCVCVCQCACVCVWACNLCKQSLVSSLYAASWSAFPSSWGCPCAIIPDGKLWFSILSLFSSVF